MRKMLSFICVLILAALLPTAFFAIRQLPMDGGSIAAEKYAGWNGVLQAWVCSRWSCSGGFITWLNSCAAKFEKNHEGVYIEFTPVDESTLHSGMRLPDMVFLSPGITDTSEEALPVAMGGYIWVYNRALTDAPPGQNITLLPDDPGRSFTRALQALMSGDTPAAEMDLPETGIDLGLPASAAAVNYDPDALDRFIDGEIPALVVSQKELAKLIRLRDAGKGPDWTCAPTGDYAFTDQLLLAAVMQGTDEASMQKQELCEAFRAQLLGEDAQAALTGIGAFSATGETIYPGHSPYAPLDVLLHSRPVVMAGCGQISISEH